MKKVLNLSLALLFLSLILFPVQRTLAGPGNPIKDIFFSGQVTATDGTQGLVYGMTDNDREPHTYRFILSNPSLHPEVGDEVSGIYDVTSNIIMIDMLDG